MRSELIAYQDTTHMRQQNWTSKREAVGQELHVVLRAIIDTPSGNTGLQHLSRKVERSCCKTFLPEGLSTIISAVGERAMNSRSSGESRRGKRGWKHTFGSFHAHKMLNSYRC